eukprot:4009190-Alexandrium_andersonii.AAC.1
MLHSSHVAREVVGNGGTMGTAEHKEGCVNTIPTVPAACGNSCGPTPCLPFRFYRCLREFPPMPSRNQSEALRM